MTFSVRRNSDGSITAESNCPGSEIDHVYAQSHSRELAHYMEDTRQESVDGRNYDDVVNRLVDEENRKYGYSPATRMEISNKLVW